MNRDEFEKHLKSLSDEQYSSLIQERIGRLNNEQKAIAQARESKRQDRAKLISLLTSSDPDVHQMVFDSLRDMDGDECEHGRSYAKHCLACGEIDHLMFPELFDQDGFELEDEKPETD